MDQLAGQGGSGATCLDVDRLELVEVTRRRRLERGKGALDDVRDSEEGKLLGQERFDGDFVRRVEYARCGTARLSRRPRERETGEGLLVGRRELEDEAGAELERRDRRRRTLGIGER